MGYWVIKGLKIQMQLQPMRHRSFINFQVNMVSILIAYIHLAKKPSLNLQELDEIRDLLVLDNFTCDWLARFKPISRLTKNGSAT